MTSMLEFDLESHSELLDVEARGIPIDSDRLANGSGLVGGESVAVLHTIRIFPHRLSGLTRGQGGRNRITVADMTLDAAPQQTEMVDLPRAECLGLLAAGGFGRLAVDSGHGPPLLRPVNYLFDEPSQAVVFRTAKGSKFQKLLASRKASFEIDGIDAETRTGWSVIITGVTEEVTNAADVRRLESRCSESWAPGAKPHWVRIRAWTVSGRRIQRALEPAARACG
jgi:uncharacterized protein